MNKKERYQEFKKLKEERLKNVSGTFSFPDIDPQIRANNEQVISRFNREQKKSKRVIKNERR